MTYEKWSGRRWAGVLAGVILWVTGLDAAAVPPAGESAKTPTQVANGQAAWGRDDAAHLLRRAGFSGTPEQINKLHAMGKAAAVEYLITGTLPAGSSAANAPFASVKLEPFHEDAAPVGNGKGAQQRKGVEDISEQWIDRMIRTDRPLVEKMTLFWHGLFTSGVREVKSADQMLAQNHLFHENALGNYRSLTLAIVHDPAMLKYLNNNENVKGKPNENLARELCELFTMGEGQGYTEKDVGEIARALTGATVSGGKKNAYGEYVFRASSHDDGSKTIFGKTGNYKPDDVVDLIFKQPQPAEHLARRLWEFFAYPDPTDRELSPIAAALREHQYDVVPAVRALFMSPDFYSEKAKFAIIKSPTDLLVSTIRMLDQPIENALEERSAVSILGTMGQQLFQPPNVRGWPGGEDWITAATLFCRYNAATELVNDDLRPERQGKPNAAAGNKVPNRGRGEGRAAGGHAVLPRNLFPNLPAQPTADQVVDAAISRFLQRPLHAEKRKVLVDVLSAGPLRLGERATDDRIRQMLGLLLSTPEFQVE